MYLPEVADLLRERQIKSVILVGIEVICATFSSLNPLANLHGGNRAMYVFFRRPWISLKII